MFVKIISEVLVARKVQKVGSVVELDDQDARLLIHQHQAVEASEPVEEKPAEETEKKKK